MRGNIQKMVLWSAHIMLIRYSIQSCCFILILGISTSNLQDDRYTFLHDFSCVNQNWEKVVCKWSFSDIDDQSVSLFWSPDIPLAHWYRCPIQTTTSCEWYVIDDGIDIERRYNIRLNTSSLSQNFRVRWNELVRPDPVYDLQASPISNSCISLRWKHSNFIYNKTYMIELFSNKDSTKIVVKFHSDNDILEKILCNLSTYTNYTVTITCKPVVLGFWSEAVKTFVTTHKFVPASSPSLLAGGFSWRRASHNPTTNLSFYWHPLNRVKWNSDRIHYMAFLESRTRQVLPKGGGNFYATFEVHRNYSYDGKLLAYNDIGNSTSAMIRVLPYEDCIFIEEVFAIVDDRNNMHVMWKPTEGLRITSNFIFWCEHAFGDICKRAPNTIQVSNESVTEHEYIIRDAVVDKHSYLLGVAYITETNYTAGFIWSDCLFITSKEFQIKLKLTTTPVENGIYIKWRFPKCDYDRLKSLISFYILHICTTETCTEYQEYKFTGHGTFLEISMKTICVRVYPHWNNTDGDSASIECVQIPQGFPVAIIIGVGSIFILLSVFGCFMAARKLRKTMNTMNRPFVIEVPTIDGQTSSEPRVGSGLPLLNSCNSNIMGSYEVVANNSNERDPEEYSVLYVT